MDLNETAQTDEPIEIKKDLRVTETANKELKTSWKTHTIAGTTIEIPTKYKRITKILAPVEKLIDFHDFGWKVARKGTKKTKETITKQHIVHYNRFSALETEDDIENNNDIISKISGDMKLCELRNENNSLQKNIQRTEEQYDVEMMNVQVLQAFINSIQEDCDRGNKAMELEISMHKSEIQVLHEVIQDKDSSIATMKKRIDVLINDMKHERQEL